MEGYIIEITDTLIVGEMLGGPHNLTKYILEYDKANLTEQQLTEICLGRMFTFDRSTQVFELTYYPELTAEQIANAEQQAERFASNIKWV